MGSLVARVTAMCLSMHTYLTQYGLRSFLTARVHRNASFSCVRVHMRTRSQAIGIRIVGSLIWGGDRQRSLSPSSLLPPLSAPSRYFSPADTSDTSPPHSPDTNLQSS